ncbi:transcription initiation factor TFIID subunit 3 isoform X1 [Engystomops pustulosus]|uniref:transcription initiation factor TFIID subunit 3 isoform X1 n=1 Tax=Engystomops pustulosus TaxID=76066 RepID=UPI003AFB7A3B
MCESYSRSLLRVSVAQICQALGWDSVQVTACDLLTDVLHRYLQQLCRGAHRYSELYGRTDPVLDDVGQAFKLMGVNIHELEDYIHNIEPVTFPHQIPSFPVTKNNVLQFPPPGSKDVEDRKEYIPDYLPLIVSSQEEEEEEQVPTDGGTSAEAMQVPLEEAEMEDEETINDENYLSKRPLESPESLEMPFAKRQRLANSKGDVLDGTVEPREPLSSINAQKVSPMLSPTHLQDKSDLTLSSPEPVMLSPVLKPQTPSSKPLESKAFSSKTKSKGSPGQKSKSPKSSQLTTVLGSPMRSPKSTVKDKKSPGRAKSPKSPKSPKATAPTPQPVVKPETPSRTPLAALSEKIGRENIQIKQNQSSQDSEKINFENPSKKPSVSDNTIEDSIDAVIARACAEQEPDPFEFSSGSESEGDVFTSPKRLTIAEPSTPKVSAANSSLGKACSTPLPVSGGTSSSDISWTMDDSINEVIRKVSQETPSNMSISQPCFSSPSASPPTPEPLVKIFEDKSKLASPVELKKKTKKELKTKLKKKDKEKQKDKDKSKDKNKDKSKEKDKDKDGIKDSKLQWKDTLKEEDGEMPRLKSKDLNDSDQKPKQKESSGKKEKEKHKDKKKDKEKSKKDKEKKERGKDKNKEEKLKSAPSTPVVLPTKDISLPMMSTPNAVRLPSLMPSMSPLVPEKVTEEREKTKDKDKKKEKKEKKKKKDKEKVKEKEKEKKEKDKKDKDKEKHKHEKQAKVELAIPAPSPVIPRLTLRVGAGQDTIVISKVVSAPDAKTAPPPSLPKSPPPVPSPAPVPVLVPPPVQAPPAPAAASPAPNPVAPAPGPNTGNSKTPYRSVVTETVSTYVIRDEWGNQIWICPGCNKLDDGSPMVGCDGCDEWYHWPCVGLTAEPEEDKWFCKKCDGQKKDKKHKKRKHKAH